MIQFKSVFVLLCYSVYVTQCAPTEASSSTTTEAAVKDSSEAKIPPNMNIADYYYSIFGKHLDYDYREPLITFGEKENNDVDDDIESEVDHNSDVLWTPASHNREKRFVIPVPVGSNFYNSTRRFWQEQRRLRMERRRLRNERRHRWRQNRINYLNQRAESLRRQADLLTQRQAQQLAQRQITRTRSVPTQNPGENTFRITLPVTSTSASQTDTTVADLAAVTDLENIVTSPA